MKNIIAVLLALIMLFTLVGCAKSETPDSNTPDDSSKPVDSAEDIEIAVVLMALNQDYWHIIEAGANAAAKELGCKVKVVGPAVETDVAAQISLIEDCLNSGSAGMLLAPTDPSTITPSLEIAKENGVPIVCVDSDVEDTSLRLTFIGSSDYDGGVIAGEYLAENFPEGTIVGVLRGPLGAASHNARVDGCQEKAEEAGLVFVDVQDAQCDRATAMTVGENMLEGHPEIQVFYCTNDEMAAGAYQACVDKGREDIAIIGFDGSPDCLGLIAEKKVTGTVAQSPFDMGFEGVQILYKAITTGEFDGGSETFIDTKVVDQATAAEHLDTLRARITEAIGDCWF